MLIDFRLQHLLARRTAHARLSIKNAIYLNVQQPIHNIPRDIEIPSWFMYLTYFFKV
jgi:hypothetical protein